MKVYVAGASAELDRVAKYIAVLREAGIEITHDWTKSVADNGGPANDQNIPKARRAAIASADILGVQAADHLWLITPENQSLGCWVELGAAVTDPEKTVIVSGPWRSIFQDMADHQFTDHDEALRFLLQKDMWVRPSLVDLAPLRDVRGVGRDILEKRIALLCDEVDRLRQEHPRS